MNLFSFLDLDFACPPDSFPPMISTLQSYNSILMPLTSVSIQKFLLFFGYET